MIRPEPSVASSASRWALALVLCLGAGLRLAFLGTPSFWWDEMVQARTALASSLAESLGQVPANKPPLFYVVEYFVARFSASEFALRLPSCLAGILAIPILWKLVRKITGDALAALAAAALLAVAPMPIRYSQEARGYSVMFLFSLLGVEAMFRYEERPRLATLGQVALWPALACWTYYFALSALFAQIVWTAAGLLTAAFHLGQCRRDPSVVRRKGCCLAALGISVLALIPLVYRTLSDPDLNVQISSGPGTGFLGLAWVLAGRFGFGLENCCLWPFAVVNLGLCLAGAAVGLARRRSATLFLLIWLIGFQALQIWGYPLANRWFSPRYHLVYYIPLLTLASIGLSACLRLFGSRRRLAFLVFALVIGSQALGAVSLLKARWLGRPTWRGVLDQMATEAGPNDAFVGSGPDIQGIYEFYRKRFQPDAPAPFPLKSLGACLSQWPETDALWVAHAASWGPENAPFIFLLCPDLRNVAPTDTPVLRRIPAEGDFSRFVVLDCYEEQLGEMALAVPSRLEIGAPETEPLLGRGWSSPEDWSGRHIRWIEGKTAELLFISESDRPSTATISALSFSGETYPKPAARLFLDGALLGEARDVPGTYLAEFRFAVPPEAYGPGPLHTLRVICDDDLRAHRPPGPDGEQRDLSLAVWTVDLE